MKQKYLLLPIVALFLFASCGSDELDFLLSLDGVNQTAPNVDAGIHEFAAQYTSGETEDYNGQELIEVTWFNSPVAPARTEVRVYGPGTNNTPGALLYSADVTNGLRLLDWNRHVLATPVAITGQELWISILVEHATTQQSVGCDAGPNVSGGDWLMSDGVWQTFTQRTGESVNWNIRGVVSRE